MDVLIILIVSYHWVSFANRFCNVRRIPTMLFACFFPVGCIWIWWILENRWIHFAIFRSFQSKGSVFFHEYLFRKSPDQKLVFRNTIIAATAFFHKRICIRQDACKPAGIIFLPLMVDNLVKILWIIIVLKTFNFVILFIFMKIFNKVGKAGIEQLHAA